MIYSTNIRKAIKFSVKTHEVYQKQKRKGKDIPYITHPLAVGIILARAGASDEVIIAGILHDTIEDSVSEKKVTREMLAERFGEEVASLVVSVTETDKSLSWEERKKEALAHIKTFSHGALLVKSADIISNAFELLDDHNKEGEEIFSHFNAPKEKILKHYQATITAIVSNWEESPLTEDLKFLATNLQKLDTGKTMKKYKVTFGSLVGSDTSKDYVVETESEEDARSVALNKLLAEESDGMLLDSPLQMATVEEVVKETSVSSDPQENYKEYKERFSSMSDEQLIDAFNREKGNSGWTSSRATYLFALHEEFEKRNIKLEATSSSPKAIEKPKSGDIVYIDTSIHVDDFAGRDRTGGKVTVDKVTEENGEIWITVKEFPVSSYNWNTLEEQQEYLKEEFGDNWAHR